MTSLFLITFRTIFFLTLLLLAIGMAEAQTSKLELTTLDHLAAKASTTVDVNIDERLIRVALKAFTEPEDSDVKKIVENLKGVYVKSFEFDEEGGYTSGDVEAVRSQLRGPNWSRMVNVISKKEGNIEVYILLEGERIGGLAVLSSEAKELTVVNIVGPVDIERLTKLEGQFGIPDLGIESTKPKTKNEQ